jgi:hypothetical protein
MDACGADFESLKATEFYVSHEALLFDYERPMTRIDSRTGNPYATSGHFLWVGERTRQIDGAHIDFMSRIRNPIGVKLGPSTEVSDVMALIEKLPSQTFNSLYRSHKDYLQYKPLKVGEEKKFKRKNLKERGVKVDEYWKAERNRCVKWYIDSHCDRIFFPRLLKDCMTYDPDIDRKKFDSVDAFGGVIIHSEQELLLKVLDNVIEDDYGNDFFFGITITNNVIQVR